MSNPIPDLWPPIEQPQITPPVAILREQAAALGRKTTNLLEGRVDTTLVENLYAHLVPSAKAVFRGDREAVTPTKRLRHRFSIVAPALDDYIYELFWIEHGVDPYPVTAPNLETVKNGPHELMLEKEGDLVEYIRKVLNSERTMRIVGSLLAQVKATA